MSKVFSQFTEHTQMVLAVTVIIVAALIGIAVITWQQGQVSTTAAQVISAFRASFPSFCTDGQLLTHDIANDRVDFDPHDPAGRYWGIQCDSWLKNPSGFYGYATIVDAAQCTTIRPVIGTLGAYYYEVEKLNKSVGEKMAVCPGK